MNLYHKVPKTLKENLAFRRKLLKRAEGDEEYCRQMINACKMDMLFFVNCFVFTYDPRVKRQQLPFITYPFQDETMLAMDRAINDSIGNSIDIVIEKTRDMGATWLSCLVLLWRWQFHDMQTFLVASRKEDYVDKYGNPDCLFAKFDFAMKRQPIWLLPRFQRAHMTLANVQNGSTINGDTTNSDLGRGGRRTAILIDEAASVPNLIDVEAATGDVTNCRFFNSTPKGRNYFYRLREKARVNDRLITLHWRLHPKKAAGLYTSG